jgi:hypothetical protein
VTATISSSPLVYRDPTLQGGRQHSLGKRRWQISRVGASNTTQCWAVQKEATEQKRAEGSLVDLLVEPQLEGLERASSNVVSQPRQLLLRCLQGRGAGGSGSAKSVQAAAAAAAATTTTAAHAVWRVDLALQLLCGSGLAVLAVPGSRPSVCSVVLPQ